MTLTRNRLVRASLLALLAAFCLPALATDLAEHLTQSLGITKAQAEGGAGAVFAAAKPNLGDAEFQELSALVPNMDSLLAAAPDAGMSKGLMGAASSALGGSADSAGSAAQLAESFAQLGMDSKMVEPFVNAIFDYLGSSPAGGTAVSMLRTALGF